MREKRTFETAPPILAKPKTKTAKELPPTNGNHMLIRRLMLKGGKPSLNVSRLFFKKLHTNISKEYMCVCVCLFLFLLTCTLRKKTSVSRNN